MRLTNTKYIKVATSAFEDNQSSFIQIPDITTGKTGKAIRLATVEQVLDGTKINGCSPVTVGMRVALCSSWDGSTHRDVVLADDVFATWVPEGGGVTLAPIGDRACFETGFWYTEDGDYANGVGYLSKGGGAVMQEGKLGEHATLRAVSPDMPDMLPVLMGLNRRCYLAHTDTAVTSHVVVGSSGRFFLFTRYRAILGIGGP